MQIIGTRLSQIIIMKPDKSILAQLTILGNFEYIIAILVTKPANILACRNGF